MPDRDRIPFVSTTLRAFWLPTRATGDVVWSQPVMPDGTIGKLAPYYRLTPAVYAWMRLRIGGVEDRVAAGEQELAEALLEAAERWRPLAEWAERTYTREEMAAAAPHLPKLEETSDVVEDLLRLGKRG